MNPTPDTSRLRATRPASRLVRGAGVDREGDFPMLSESDFPTTEDVTARLTGLPQAVELDMIECDGDTPHIDVRLQVSDDGSWAVHTGDACYDTDHRGWWGAASVQPDTTPADLAMIARDLREQALDDCATAGELAERGPAGEVRDLFARVSDDGYLLSVAAADQPEPRWADYYSDEWADGELQTVMLRAVPVDLAARLERHGTSEQDFSDGYTAWAACLPYAQRP